LFAISKKNVISAKRPILTVVIDTEEEFDWSAPFNRQSRATENIKHQYLAQNIFKKYDIVPTYVIDYAVVENEQSVEILKDFADKGECVIGTHLHPWVSPPYDEDVNRVNSYAGNLPREQERDKLSHLTDEIEKKFGKRPVIYKAGRYGFGPNTASVLKELGYFIDTSLVADTSFTYDHGPDFRGLPTQPFLFDGEGQQMLEIPNSRGYDGFLARWGSSIYPLLAGQAGWRDLMAGVLSKTKMLERIPLTPEGIHAADHIRMVRKMASVGHNVFNYAYHSSSLMIGGSPYVKQQADLDLFLEDMDQFFDFFINDFQGVHQTPLDLWQSLEKTAA